jgi:hypothetical protein
MSLLRRLYNVAYGRVRAWQSGDALDEALEQELHAARERPVGLRERWTPPEDVPDGGEPSRDAELADPVDQVPRARRL